KFTALKPAQYQNCNPFPLLLGLFCNDGAQYPCAIKIVVQIICHDHGGDSAARADESISGDSCRIERKAIVINELGRNAQAFGVSDTRARHRNIRTQPSWNLCPDSRRFDHPRAPSMPPYSSQSAFLPVHASFRRHVNRSLCFGPAKADQAPPTSVSNRLPTCPARGPRALWQLY